MPTSASPRATRSTPGSCRARLRRPLGLPCGPTCAGAAAPSAAGRCLSDSPRYEEDFRQHLRRRRRRPFFFVQAPACPAPSLAPVVLRALARDRAVRVALRLSGDKTNQNGSIGERSNALEIEPERVASERARAREVKQPTLSFQRDGDSYPLSSKAHPLFVPSRAINNHRNRSRSSCSRKKVSGFCFCSHRGSREREMFFFVFSSSHRRRRRRRRPTLDVSRSRFALFPCS